MEPRLLLALLGLAALLVLGLIGTGWRLWRTHQSWAFTHDYINQFRKLVSSLAPGKPRGLSSRELLYDQELYEWLTRRVIRMQRELGHMGVMVNYRPPFEHIVYRSYELLTNTLPQIRTGWVHDHDLHRCDDVMLAHLGELEQKKQDAFRRLINPLAWLAEGARFIITLPLRLAYLSGLMGHDSYARAAGSWITGLLAYIVAVGAGLITIVVLWEDAMKIVRQWLGG